MLWFGGDAEISVALVNAALLALWPVLPTLIVCHVGQVLRARRIRPIFALRKSEVHELDRARTLLKNTCNRLKSTSEQNARRVGFWLTFTAPSPDATPEADEMDDLRRLPGKPHGFELTIFKELINSDPAASLGPLRPTRPPEAGRTARPRLTMSIERIGGRYWAFRKR